MWEPPAADMPLREIFETLDAEARRGNATAACRVALELDRCQRAWPLARNMLGAMEEIDRRNSAKNIVQPHRAVHRATMEAVFEQLETICAGSEVFGRLNNLRYLGIAADGGSVPSMVRYLEPHRLNAGALLDDPALLAHFRANARTYFLAALRTGDISLLPNWRNSLLSPHDSALFRVLPDEFRNIGLVNALLAQLSAEQHGGLLLGSREPGIGERPTPADHARAAELYRAHFSHSPPARSATGGGDNYNAQLLNLAALDPNECD